VIKMSVIEVLYCHELIKAIPETTAWQNALKTSGRPKLPIKSAYSCAARASQKPAVKAYLKKLLDAKHGSAEKVCAQAKMVIDELDMICQVDPRDYFEEVQKENDVTVLRMKSLMKIGKPARAIEAIEITDKKIGEMILETNTKIKFHSKLKALELLGKHHKLYTDLVQHSGNVGQGPQIYLPDNGKNKSVGD
jgi:hypothetical protein